MGTVVMAQAIGLCGLIVRLLGSRRIDVGVNEIEFQNLDQLVKRSCKESSENRTNPVNPMVVRKFRCDDCGLLGTKYQ